MAGYCVSFVPVAEPPVSVEKCMAAISHFPSFFATVRERLRGNANSFPSFFSIHVSGRHQPAHLWGHFTDPELVFEFLFSLVEILEEMLIGDLNLVRS